jgi:hypothetical protein
MLGMEVSSFAERHSMDRAVLAQDPLLEAIIRYRQGLHDFTINAPNDRDAAELYAEKTYRPPRRMLVAWDKAALTFVGAVSALKMANDADGNDDSEMVSAMVKAALGYFEAIR